MKTNRTNTILKLFQFFVVFQICVHISSYILSSLVIFSLTSSLYGICRIVWCHLSVTLDIQVNQMLHESALAEPRLTFYCGAEFFSKPAQANSVDINACSLYDYWRMWNQIVTSLSLLRWLRQISAAAVAAEDYHAASLSRHRLDDMTTIES